MKCSETGNCYDALIRKGSEALAAGEVKQKSMAFRDFLRRVIIMRVFRG